MGNHRRTESNVELRESRTEPTRPSAWGMEAHSPRLKRLAPLPMALTCLILGLTSGRAGFGSDAGSPPGAESPARLKPTFTEAELSTESGAAQALNQLRAAVRYHDYRYYQLQDPVISDGEYDDLKRQLRSIEARYPTLRMTASSKEEQAPSSDNTIRHPIPMLSLEAVHDATGLQNFHADCLSRLKVTSIEFVAEPKFDGMAIELFYEKGRLARAATRGDGAKGEDVTAAARLIPAIPRNLETGKTQIFPENLVVRGEVIMPIAPFRELNRQLLESGEKVYSNPRNAAAGILRNQSKEKAGVSALAFFAYQMVGAEASFETHEAALAALLHWGFPVSEDHNRLCRTAADMIQYWQALDAKRPKLPFEMDGVVFKLNRLDLRNDLGLRTDSPRWAVACKFAPTQKTTLLKDILVQVGRSGVLTPVAILEPIQIGGATIERASLNNFSEISRRDLRIGDRVLVERAGDVIPQVLKSIPDFRTGKEQSYIPPSTCPSCDTPIRMEEDSTKVFCTGLECKPQLVGRLTHFASSTAMQIKGLGEKLAEKLVEAGLIRDSLSIYSLREDDLTRLQGVGEKTARSLLEQIDQSRSRELSRFLVAIGIPGIGEQKAAALAACFKNLEEMADAKPSDLLRIDGFGKKQAEDLHAFLSGKTFKKVVQEVKEYGLSLPNSSYNGKSE